MSQPPMLPLETTHGDGEHGSEGSEIEAAECSSGISGSMSEVVTPGSSADVIDVGADAGSASPDASFNGDDVSAYGSLATASLGVHRRLAQSLRLGPTFQIQRRQWRIMCRYRFGRGHRC